MASENPDSGSLSKPQGSLVMEILACIVAAIILTAVAYPIARFLLTA